MVERLSEVFERKVRAFPVSSGTGANAVSLSVLSNGFGSIYCHKTSHIEVHEAGAAEFYTGAKLVLLEGHDYKVSASTLDAALQNAGIGDPGRVLPFAVSLAQPTDWVAEVLGAIRDMELAVESADLAALLDADRRFHEGIVAGSRSQRIRRFYRNLQTEIRLTRTWHGEREPSPVFFARHKEVVEAIQSRDARQAEKLLGQIIDVGEARVQTSLIGAATT